MVRAGTVVAPGSDAAVLRIKADSLPPQKKGFPVEETIPVKYIAMTVDCNGTHVYLDPYEGGKATVAEAARNLACTGARPLGATDNLNFGNPHNPEIFWQLKESVRGLAEACRAFNAPITGGNVSLYNQNPNGPIDPTPTVAMVGLIKNPEHITTQWFKDEGDRIILVGDLADTSDALQGLGGSAYLQVIHGQKTGSPPRCDLVREKAVHDLVISVIEAGLVKSAHDCSEGGLAVALAESCISQQVARETPRLIGAIISLADSPASRLDGLLFGESHSRIVISASEQDATDIIEAARKAGVPACEIGIVGGTELQIETSRGTLTARLTELHDAWWNAIARAMR